MKRTILADVDGFTPIIDDLAKEYGLMRAAVFGRMWRFCQMSDNVCRASLETIAEGLGIDKATVMRHAQELVNDGYLKDLTPEKRNSPHIYQDTGKAGIRISVGVAQSNATVAERNAGVAQSNATVAESKLKIVSKKETEERKKESTAQKTRGNPALYSLAVAISEVCGMNFEANKGRLMREAKLLSAALPAPTPELIKANYNGDPRAFWKAQDWRGKKGQRPTPQAIRETWGNWDAPRELSVGEQWLQESENGQVGVFEDI